MLSTFLNLFLAGGITLTCMLAGRTLARTLNWRFSYQSEGLVLSTGLGYAVLIGAMVLIGAIDRFEPTLAWMVLAAVLLLGLYGAVRWPFPMSLSWRAAPFREFPWLLKLLLVIVVVDALLYTLVALSPTFEGDSLAGYLLRPREFAAAGGIVPVDYAYTNELPANGEMLATLGFLINGQILAQLLMVTVMGLLGAGAVYAIGRRWFSAKAGIYGAAIWYGMGSVGFLAASGKVDLAWAAFDLLALLSFGNWFFAKPSERQVKWLLLAGIFLGVAGGAKQVSGFTAIALVLAVAIALIQARERGPVGWLKPYVALGAPASLALLWAIRAYDISGTIGFSGDSLLGESGVLGFFKVLWQMSMLGNAVSTEGPLGKPIGPSILALIPMVVFLRHVDKRAWYILAFSALMVIMWYFGVQRARHLLPTLGLLSVVSGYVIALLWNRKPLVATVIVALTLGGLGLSLGTWVYPNFISLNRLPYVIGVQNEDEYLAANLPKLTFLPNYEITSFSRQNLPQNAQIAGLTSGSGDARGPALSFYIQRPMYNNWAQSPAEIMEPSVFYQGLRNAGITHVFVDNAAVTRLGLEGAWLAQEGFQDRYMREQVCSDDQCLYELTERPTDGSY